jgi:hypothetical protein
MQTTAHLSRTTRIVIAIAFALYSAYNLVLTALQDYILFVSSDPSALGTSFGIFTLSAVVSRFISGYILERIDDAVALVIGNCILTMILAVYPLTSNIAVIFSVRAAQGFGWALSTVTVLTMIAENTESSRVSVALGYLNGFGSISLLMFPAFGGWLVGIKTFEAFQLSFIMAAGISGVSTSLSIYTWRTSPVAVTHDIPMSGIADRTVLAPTLSASMLFMALGVLLSYSPEIAALNGIENPGVFFSVFAFAQIIGSTAGGVWTGSSRYGQTATVGALITVGGVSFLVLFSGAFGYVASALAVGFGLAMANIALNSYVSVVSVESEAKGMAMYSAGGDTAIAIGSFGTAALLGVGWSIAAILVIFACTAFLSSLYSYFAIGFLERRS